MLCPFVTNILHFVLNITGNTSNDLLQKLQMSGEVFSPPEPSRAKFTPSGRVFRLSRPLAWTLISSKHTLLLKRICVLITILINLVSHLWDIGKQCRHRSDAPERIQGLHCLLTGISIKNQIKTKKIYQTPLKLEMDLSN